MRSCKLCCAGLLHSDCGGVTHWAGSAERHVTAQSCSQEEGSSHQHQAPAALAAGMRVPSAQEQALGSNAERRSRLGDERLKSTASIDVLQGMSPLGDRAGD